MQYITQLQLTVHMSYTLCFMCVQSHVSDNYVLYSLLNQKPFATGKPIAQ